MKIFDLPCFDGRKSFYGKAKVIEEDNGEKVLQSYNTRVCRITSNGEFVRMCGGSSVTTLRHVNSFLQLYDIPGGGMVDGSTGRRVPEKAGAGYDFRGKLPGYDGP